MPRSWRILAVTIGLRSMVALVAEIVFGMGRAARVWTVFMRAHTVWRWSFPNRAFGRHVRQLMAAAPRK